MGNETYGSIDMPLEEVIKLLEECCSALTDNIELLKHGIRPLNEDWVRCAVPFSKCMNYLTNNHKELEDNNYNSYGGDKE